MLLVHDKKQPNEQHKNRERDARMVEPKLVTYRIQTTEQNGAEIEEEKNNSNPKIQYEQYLLQFYSSVIGNRTTLDTARLKPIQYVATENMELSWPCSFVRQSKEHTKKTMRIRLQIVSFGVLMLSACVQAMSFYRRRYYFHCFYFYLLVIFDNFCCFSHVTYAVARNTCVLKCGQSSDFFGNVSAFTLIYTDTLVASINTKTIIFSLSEIYRVQRKGFCSQHPE